MIRYQTEFTVPPDDTGGMTGIKFEDGGQAAIMYDPLPEPGQDQPDSGLFVRLHSWEEDYATLVDPDPLESASVPGKMIRGHRLFRSLMGKRVRITIEEIDS